MIFDGPVSFADALATATAKQLLPTSLSSAELRGLSGELRRRSVFSAKVVEADILATLQSAVETLASGDVAGSSYSRAKDQLLKAIRRTGYVPGEDEAGTIKDLTSDARLSLMLETNVRDVQGAGAFIAGNDPVALEINPGLELIRAGSPEAPRDWLVRWQAARAATIAEGATDGSERMVALKNHPIWQALGDGAGGFEDTLGNPWAPFAFNSTMVLVECDREDCIALGIMDENTRVPSAEEQGLNEGLLADASRFPTALLDALRDNPDLQVRDGVLTLR